MPIIEIKEPSLENLDGIHLWHAGMSSCSQRVRIALSEKGLSFVSHEVDLQAGENATDSYQRIHPQGLVPALLFDGDLVIESIDIIREIERRTPEPSLMPTTETAIADAKEILRKADASQPFLKLLTFEFLFSAAPPPPKAQHQAFLKNHRNAALTKFHEDAAKGFERSRVREAVKASMEGFSYLDALLKDGRQYLSGSRFSLADIAWMPNVHRYSLFEWPFEKTRYLAQWFERVTQRPSYAQALVAWQPAFVEESIRPAIKKRKAQGDGVETYGLL